MSAFPAGVPTANTLQDRRNELRTEVATLHGVVSQLQNWVEQIERDRILMVPSVYADDAAFDAAWNTVAGSLLTAVRAETSLSTSSFLYRMRAALQLQGYNFTHNQTTSSTTWSNITHNLGYNPEVVVYTWDAGMTVLTQVTPVSVTYPTPNVTVTITLPASAQGVVKFL